MEPLQGALDREAHPFGAVVEFRRSDPANFCDDAVAGARVLPEDGGRVQGLPEELLRGPVVRRGVEGADAKVEGALDDGIRWDQVGRGIVEIVEGRGAADERGEDGGEGGLRWWHLEPVSKA